MRSPGSCSVSAYAVQRPGVAGSDDRDVYFALSRRGPGAARTARARRRARGSGSDTAAGRPRRASVPADVQPSSDAAAVSRITVVVPLRERTRLAGVLLDGSSANARRTAAAFSSPTARKTTWAPLSRAGIVSVTRSTNGSRPRLCGDREPVAHVERGRAGEERCRVAVRAEAQQHEVERLIPEGGVVGGGSGGRRERGRDRVHRRPDHEPLEQGFADEQLVRAGIVGGDAAVVAEPELDAAPVGVRRGRELVGVPGRRAARQDHRAVCLGDLHEQRGRRNGRRGCVGHHDEVDAPSPNPPSSASARSRWPERLSSTLPRQPRPRAAVRAATHCRLSWPSHDRAVQAVGDLVGERHLDVARARRPRARRRTPRPTARRRCSRPSRRARRAHRARAGPRRRRR